MAEVTITVDPVRLRWAIEEELDHHHVHLASGQCECGRFRGKDPAQMRAHAAEEVLSVVLRFQRVEVRKADVLSRREAMVEESIYDTGARPYSMGLGQPMPSGVVHPAACHGDRDGDCHWSECPQKRDGEPWKSGRHCPLDVKDPNQ